MERVQPGDQRVRVGDHGRRRVDDGVAGLTLGGGLGWLMGTHGLSVDNLTQVEVVTADGQVRLVDAEHEPDLFWALRGGGGNFGVAASLEFETHPLDRSSVVCSPTHWPPLQRSSTCITSSPRTAPDELTAFCGLVHAPDGSGMQLCAIPLPQRRAGAGRGGAGAAAAVRAADPRPRAADALPGGQLDARRRLSEGCVQLWKSAFFTELTDAAVQTLIDTFEAVPSIMSGVVIEHFHRGLPDRPDGHRVPVPRARVQPGAHR